eukprot:CAMPEP_0175931662 /NCGR_PEP_ID=MMETSP0108-20121206/18971_1 /TAXON_ID=195067 ORGANISM="Goniomonas pacifica, Strain CCMP1869" /NCGR_SAMPLE_ID=MMETSP0108 /ASSEMBLY_ACC=CAM_ASM_000204 /LENGTH=62 /DNA_ID=CAMNT_0017255239 /DNA_START=197 /DNA_END=382 /DNA_ORIENTATION=+
MAIPPGMPSPLLVQVTASSLITEMSPAATEAFSASCLFACTISGLYATQIPLLRPEFRQPSA